MLIREKMMGSVCHGLLVTVNVVLFIGGAALAGVGVWAYLLLNEIVSLRDANTHSLDYQVYWPQVAPWLFVFGGLAVLPVALIGLCSALSRNRPALSLHAVLLLLLALVHVTITGLTFTYINGEPTEKFITESVSEAIGNAKVDSEVLKAFGQLEQRLRCCGAEGSNDYRKWSTILEDLPLSCCSYGSVEATSCSFMDREGNKRFGCSQIAFKKMSRLSEFMGAGAAAVGVLEVIGFVAVVVMLARRHSHTHGDSTYEKTHIEGLK